MAASFTIGEYLLPNLIAQWTHLHPKSLVHLRIMNTHQVAEAVAGFDVDVGFIEGPQTHTELVAQHWLNDELVIFAAPGHPLVRRIATPQQLSEATWVVREHGSGTRQATDIWLLQNLEQVRVGFELGSSEAIKRVVAAGDGLGCLSRFAVAQSLGDGRLVELRTRLPKAARKLSIVLHKEKRLGRATTEFLAHCNAERRRAGRARKILRLDAPHAGWCCSTFKLRGRPRLPAEPRLERPVGPPAP